MYNMHIHYTVLFYSDLYDVVSVDAVTPTLGLLFSLIFFIYASYFNTLCLISYLCLV